MAGYPSKRSFGDVAHLSSWHPEIPQIACALTQICLANDLVEREKWVPAARMSVTDYLIRLCKYSYCSGEVFVVLLVLLRRLTDSHGIRLTSRTVYSLIIGTFVVAVKVKDDVIHKNSFYAEVGCVTVQELNSYERFVLASLDWNIYTGADDYHQAIENLGKLRPLLQRHIELSLVPPIPSKRIIEDNSHGETSEVEGGPCSNNTILSQ
eukprot:TRINITY_DN27773_c0_g1_i1.p1 TRINITY_DN27773_c0_g1~~TRINITY_DN27773_c0_g1_i1.p1  ORF type:complete len:209 (+),score=17.49 TRINITY_DN27773_c0_g1_i1:53-679(+)